VHLQLERGAEKGMAKYLHHVQSLEEAPELVLFGGDCVMDVFNVKDQRSKTLRDLWLRTLKSECSLPSHAAVGKHDIWGWNKIKAERPEMNRFGVRPGPSTCLVSLRETANQVRHRPLGSQLNF
jgi:hypothetical protein